MAAVQRLKLKQTPIDVWSVRERLVLASSVLRSGDQNWVSVSRAIKPFGEPNRPSDWFSPKNCALQYSELLEKVETPKRKRGERGDLETPGESIVRKLTFERIEELKNLTAQQQQRYKNLKNEIEQVQSGAADDRLHEIWEEIVEEKRRQEQEVENRQKWLVAREAAKQAAQAAWRTNKILPIPKKVLSRRISNKQPNSQLEQSSELEHDEELLPIDSINVDSCGEEALSQDVGISLSISTPAAIASATTVTTVPSSTSSSHHSPLLNTLLRSTSHVSQPTTPTTPKDISPRSQAPSSFPTSLPSSVANLLTTVLSGPPDHESSVSIPRPTITSPSQGAPTLLKLLDMPLGEPGKLPPLPIVTPIQHLPIVPTASVTTVVPSVIAPVISAEEKTLDVKPEIQITEPMMDLLPEVVPPVNTQSFEEVQIKDEPVMEELETVSTIEIEVKEEPSELVVEVVELEEEIQEIKTHDDCVDLQEEEVFTEGVQPAEEILQTEIETCVTEEKVDEVPVIMEEERGGEGEGGEDEAVTEVQLQDNVEQVLDDDQTVMNEIELNTNSNLSEAEAAASALVADDLSTSVVSEDQPDGPEEVVEEVKIEEPVVVTTESESHAEEEEKEEMQPICEPVEKIATESPTSKTSTESQIIPPTSDDDDDDDEEDSSTSEVGVRPVEFRPSRRGMERGRRRRGSRGSRGRGRMFFGRWPVPVIHDESTVEEKNDESGNETSDDKGKGQDIKTATMKDVNRGIRGIRKRRDESDEQDKDETERGDNRLRKDSKREKEIFKKEDEIGRTGERRTREDSVVEGSGRDSDDENKEDTIGGRSLISTDSVPNSPASLSLCGDDPESVRDYKLWKKSIMLVWRAVANHKYANVFLHPVTDEMAPGYHSVVYRPMDLVTVKRNIENGVIKTTTEFQRDVMLMFQNAIMYNNSDHDVYKMAIDMQKEVMEHIENFVATQLMVQSAGPPKTLRRETREHSQKKGDGLPDKAGPSSMMPQEGDGKRKRLISEGEGGKTKKRRTRADDQ